MENIDFVGENPIVQNSAVTLSGCDNNQDMINHNNLGGLQGGTLNERYHLTKDQLETLIDGVQTYDIEITDSTKGIILHDTDGSRRRITLSNGVLVVSSPL